MLELDGVNRSFGERQVLHDVSFSVGRGRMTGFVGANGSGKTTTMRVILGVLAADSGTVTLDGAPLDAAARARFGYMPEERGLYPKMQVAEQIVYLGRLHGMGASEAKQSTDRLLDLLALSERANDPVESLSLGNQQRAQIAAALVHEPEVLVLDEPFSGLDPVAVEAVQSVLKEYADRGTPVLFSSHQLDIVERLCDDLVVIADGRIRASGSTDALRREHGSSRWELQVDGELDWLGAEPGLTVVQAERGVAVFDADDEASAQRALSRAVTAGRVHRFGQQHPSLAQIFKEVVS